MFYIVDWTEEIITVEMRGIMFTNAFLPAIVLINCNKYFCHKDNSAVLIFYWMSYVLKIITIIRQNNKRHIITSFSVLQKVSKYKVKAIITINSRERV